MADTTIEAWKQDCRRAIDHQGRGARLMIKVRSRPRVPQSRRIRVLPGVTGVIMDDSREPGWWVVWVEAAKLLKAMPATS